MRETSQIDFFGPGMTSSQAITQQQELTARRRASGLGAPSVGGFVSAAAKAAVRDVTLRTQITPDWVYNPSAPPVKENSFSAWWNRVVVRPSMIINTPAGPVEYAPYGKPKINLFPLIVLGTAAAAAVGGYFAFKGIRASLKG
jgi:hypothetical protein